MDEGTSFAGKMQVFLPAPPSGELFAFSGDGLKYDQKLCRVKTFFDAISTLFA